jgi:hypothetical protein
MAERGLHALSQQLSFPVKTLRVDLEQDLRRVARPRRHIRRRHSPVRPRRHRRACRGSYGVRANWDSATSGMNASARARRHTGTMVPMGSLPCRPARLILFQPATRGYVGAFDHGHPAGPSQLTRRQYSPVRSLTSAGLPVIGRVRLCATRLPRQLVAGLLVASASSRRWAAVGSCAGSTTREGCWWWRALTMAAVVRMARLCPTPGTSPAASRRWS